MWGRFRHGLRKGYNLLSAPGFRPGCTSKIRNFCLPSVIDFQRPWTSLSESEKQAWRVLGLDADGWRLGNLIRLFGQAMLKLTVVSSCGKSLLSNPQLFTGQMRLSVGPLVFSPALLRKRLSDHDQHVKVQLKRFEDLSSAQQAAVVHGLRLDVASWDALIHRSSKLDISKEGRRTEVVEKGNDGPSGLADSIISHLVFRNVFIIFSQKHSKTRLPEPKNDAGGAWKVTKRYGPALGALLSDVRGGKGSLVASVAGQLLEMLPWMVDSKEGPVQVDDLETVTWQTLRLVRSVRYLC